MTDKEFLTNLAKNNKVFNPQERSVLLRAADALAAIEVEEEGNGGGSVEAPWTDAQVANLNRWQTSSSVHPFTCPMHDDDLPGKHAMLIATNEGWRCGVQECDYTQNWAHWQMANRKPPKSVWDIIKGNDEKA